VRHYQRRVFSLLTATFFLLAWFPFEEPAGAEKQVCFHDITSDISISYGNKVFELFPEIGLVPGHHKIVSLEPGLLLGNSLRDLSLPDLHFKNIKRRGPPAHFPT
jgi:hypothetical protein